MAKKQGQDKAWVWPQTGGPSWEQRRGSLASLRRCVRAREHLGTSYIISFSNGNIIRVSYTFLNDK